MACLVVAIGYLIRAYLIPYVQETMKQRAYELALLEHEVNECVVRKEQIAHEMTEYQDNAQILFEKIERWKKSLALKEQQHAQERKVITTASAKYLKRRADGLCKDLLQRQIFPQVMEKTRKEVILFFEKKERQKKYVQGLVQGLKGGNRA